MDPVDGVATGLAGFCARACRLLRMRCVECLPTLHGGIPHPVALNLWFKLQKVSAAALVCVIYTPGLCLNVFRMLCLSQDDSAMEQLPGMFRALKFSPYYEKQNQKLKK